MKVVQINAVYGHKSTGTIVKDIDLTLQSLYYESYVAYQFCNIKPINGFKIGYKLDYKIHALISRLIGKQAYSSNLSTKLFLKYLDNIKPDVIHLHNLHSNYIHLNLLLNYIIKHKMKTIITLHDCWFFTGKCYHYDAINCKKWQTECDICPKLKDDIPSWFFDRTKSVFNDKMTRLTKIENLVIVGVSEWISNEVKKSFLKNCRVVTINNGIDTKFFYPKDITKIFKYNIHKRYVILGFANKWLDILNKNALNYIYNQMDHKSEMLLIVGCNKQQIMSLPDNVIGIDYVKSVDELADLYSIADVFVNLTWEDSFPTVNIESLACGTPVITYNSGGSAEIIDEHTGYIVEKGNYTKIWEAIVKIKKIGKQFYSYSCIERCKLNYNKIDRYMDYVKLYESLMDK